MIISLRARILMNNMVTLKLRGIINERFFNPLETIFKKYGIEMYSNLENQVLVLEIPSLLLEKARDYNGDDEETYRIRFAVYYITEIINSVRNAYLEKSIAGLVGVKELVLDNSVIIRFAYPKREKFRDKFINTDGMFLTVGDIEMGDWYFDGLDIFYSNVYPTIGEVFASVFFDIPQEKRLMPRQEVLNFELVRKVLELYVKYIVPARTRNRRKTLQGYELVSPDYDPGIRLLENDYGTFYSVDFATEDGVISIVFLERPYKRITKDMDFDKRIEVCADCIDFMNMNNGGETPTEYNNEQERFSNVVALEYALLEKIREFVTWPLVCLPRK